MAWGSCYTPDFRVVSQVGAAAGTNAANDRRLVEATNNAAGITFVTDTFDAGRYVMHLDATGATTNIALSPVATTPRYLGGLFRMRLATASLTLNHVFCRVTASTAAESVQLRATASTGILAYSFDNGSTWTNSGTTLVLGVVYQFEVFVDFNTGTTHTLKVRVNETEVVNATGGAATSTGVNVSYGVQAAAAIQIDYADMVTYNDVAQYATIDECRVYGLEPVSDGTHSMTANDFQDASSNNLTNSTTTSWDWVNDAPTAAPTVSDFVKQVVVRSTSYMEWQLRSAPGGIGAPVLVCLAAAMHPVAAANANAFAFRLNSGGNLSAEAAIDTSITSNTLEYRKHHYTTEPSSGASWTVAMAQALRARAGYDGTSITAPPALDSIMAFVVVPVSKPARTETMVGQAVTRAACW